MPNAYCPEGKHFPEYLIASVPKTLDPDGIGVQLTNEGEPTNIWADGVVGMSGTMMAFAAADESPMCPDHKCEIQWRHNGN